MLTSSEPLFWRDDRMPHVELRKVDDGRKVCYAPHTHRHWSLGAITSGQSTFQYRDDLHRIQAGSLVCMNPDWVHACNPIDNQPWGYLMLYVDAQWLTELRFEAGLIDQPVWRDMPVAVLESPDCYQGYCELAECLLASEVDLLEKQTRLVDYLSRVLPRLTEVAGAVCDRQRATPDKLQVLADYLDAHCAEEVSLDDLCARSGYSPGHLIRAFRQYFGLTPHAYQINRRIQYGQQQLKLGRPISEVAQDAGFNDQPHFQRTFKRLVAATPRQYRKR